MPFSGPHRQQSEPANPNAEGEDPPWGTRAGWGRLGGMGKDILGGKILEGSALFQGPWARDEGLEPHMCPAAHN
jgi:hypothetical protein